MLQLFIALLIAVALAASGTVQAVAQFSAFALLLYLLVKRSRSTN